ncbi:MAG: transcriptional regulator [Chlorobi bacterium]|nr:transcriptional regulator [Chlorobiota bacterium]
MKAPSLPPQSYLTAQALRELIRAARGGFPPDSVGRGLRYHSPELMEGDAEELGDLLAGLAATARERLHDAGMEPSRAGREEVIRLPKREREYVVNMAALLAYLSACHFYRRHPTEALNTANEALGWCITAGDRIQESIIWRLRAPIRSAMNDLGGEEEDCRKALAVARDSADRGAIIASLGNLCSFLIVQWRLDEAEELSTEGLALVKGGPMDRHYPTLLMHQARIMMFRTRYGESISMLREALRWSGADEQPMERAAILAHLGSVYLRLEHYQQSIECQHEVVMLAETLGAHGVQGWGYYRLAEAHISLNEFDRTEEMLDRAEQCARNDPGRALRLSIAAKRAQLFTFRDRHDEAADICRMILHEVTTLPRPDLEMFAHKTLADVAQRRGRYDEAEKELCRAIGISDRDFPQRSPTLRVCLAEIIHLLGRNADVVNILGGIADVPSLNLAEQVRVIRLRGAIAEANGDIRKALEHEREATALERTLLERRAEESLKNARIVAETDRLEREADLEREHRRRVEHELAEAVVSLGERDRMVDAVEQKLRIALKGMEASREKSAVSVVREALKELRPSSGRQESPLHYLAGIDTDFYRRLRVGYPDLTPKQERLCGLIRAGLASKEIATLMDLEAEGLKALRKRLRKRLGLQPADRLETVLAAI